MEHRNYGIDLSRIAVMLMIIIMHILSYGGLLEQARPFTFRYWVVWGIKIACYCAVNCYALISGYLMWNKYPNIARLLGIWLQVVFYNLVCVVVGNFQFNIEPDLKSILTCFFPITSYTYWYISSYFGLMLFVPILNAALERVSSYTLRSAFLIGLLMIFLNRFSPNDAYHLSNGYSLLWLMILYLIGGYFAKYRSLEKIDLRKSVLLFFVSISLTMAWKVIFEYYNSFTSQSFPSDLLFSYTSPTIILAGIAVFSFFSKIKIPKSLSKAIKSIGTATLGVYIIHMNPIMCHNLLAPIGYPLVSLHTRAMVPSLLCVTLAIFTVCTIIELVRLWLFRITGVNRLVEKVASRLAKMTVTQQ